MPTSGPDWRLIAVEGLPGSGHSEFARWIGNRPDWHAVCESPFAIPSPERGRRVSLLSVLLGRMLERHELTRSLAETDLFLGRVVTDFTFETHLLWARALLPDSEWTLYQKIAAVMPSPSVKPDLVVYLQAEESGPASALHAIDRSIDPARWSELVRAHQRHFFAYSETPLLVVRTGSQSALSSAEAKEALWRRIDDFRGGKTYLGGEVDAWLGGSPTAP